VVKNLRLREGHMENPRILSKRPIGQMSKPEKTDVKQDFDLLFAPIKVGRLTLKNRVVAAPTQTGLASHHQVTGRLKELYSARARGGAGLIMVEPGSVEPFGPLPSVGIHDDQFVRGLRELVETVHKSGAAIGMQILHMGRQWPPGLKGMPPCLVAPSAIPWSAAGQIPKELTPPEIKAIQQEFIEAARRVMQAGFDVLELHAAHGYLISQFFSGLSNRRRDAYGGGLEGKTRFAVEIIRRIKETVAPDLVLSCRLNGADHVPGGATPEDMRAIAKVLVDAGLDMVSVSAGVYGSYPTIVPPYDMPKGCYADYAAGMKGVVDVPVIVAGRITDPHEAEEILRKGKADLIALGRALIADPEWPNKAMRGEVEEIRKCIACNQCLDSVDRNALMCTVNPALLEGRELQTVHPSKSKEVMVVGGGIAGLEAARTAASRGHRVTLYEERAELGGQWRLAALPPHKKELEKLIGDLHRGAKNAGVRIIVNKRVDLKTVEAERPDVIVVATGALPRIPSIPGIEQEGLLTAWEVLEGRRHDGDRALVIGGNGLGLETADLLSEWGTRVTVVELQQHVGRDISSTARWHLLHRLREKKVKILSSTEVRKIGKGEVVVTSEKGSETLGGFDVIILAAGASPNNELASEVRHKVAEVYVIGDALAPRQGAQAILDGNKIGRRI
jgi:2,4-dienoyl-CoA reductase-like NADH-dependent reductase (Old Yellow Enzyme family)/thioredoxin reductase